MYDGQVDQLITTDERSLFDRLSDETVAMFTCNEIRRHVERHFKLDDGALLVRSRKWSISHPRQIAMALCYKHFRHRLSYEGVSRQFSDVHYSTVIYACQKMGMQPNPVLSARGRYARMSRVDAQIKRFAVAA